MADDNHETVPTPATLAQVEAAFKALTGKELKVIDRVGQTLAWPGGSAGLGWTFEDLRQEAQTRTLEGTRRWYPGEVDFVRHLAGAMRSIASEWRRRGRRWPRQLGDSMDADTDAGAQARGLRDESLSAEEAMIRREAASAELKRLRALFADDEGVSYILMGIEDNLGRAEIMKASDMTLKEYDAARNRLTRATARSKQAGGRT